MSSWYEQAAAKLKAEYSQVKGQKEQAMRSAVRDVLLEFCRQDEEFAQAVVQGGSFAACMTAVAKGWAALSPIWRLTAGRHPSTLTGRWSNLWLPSVLPRRNWTQTGTGSCWICLTFSEGAGKMSYTEREREILDSWPTVTAQDLTAMNNLFPHYLFFRRDGDLMGLGGINLWASCCGHKEVRPYLTRTQDQEHWTLMDLEA